MSLQKSKGNQRITDQEAFQNFFIKGQSQFMLDSQIEHLESLGPDQISHIERPRVNYRLLDKKLVTITGRRYTNFYLTIDGEVYSSLKDQSNNNKTSKTDS